MHQPASLRRALMLGFGTILALGSVPTVVQAAAGKEPSEVGAANFDRLQERLVIPVRGPAPGIVVKRLAPRQYVADLAGSVLLGGEAQGQRLRSPALAGWSLDEEPGSRTVRLRMTLTTDVQPRVRFDRRTGGYVVSFATPAPEGGKSAPVAVKPKPVAVKPAQLVVKPAQLAVKSAPVSVKAKPLALKPAPVAVKPAQVAAKPVRVAVKPAPVTVKPAPVAVKPAPVAVKPAPVAVKPAPMAVKPAPVTVKPASVAVKPAPMAVKLKPMAVRAAAPTVKVATKIEVKKTVAPVAVVAQKPAPSHQAMKTHLVRPALPLVVPAARDHQVAHGPAAAPKASVHRTFLAHAPRTHAPVGGVARLGVPTFDAARGLLVVPVTGDLKARDLDVVRLNKRWSYLDIPHARPTFSGVRYQERADKLFQRWVMATRPSRNTTRLSFALGAPANIDVEVAGHELLIAVRADAPVLGAAPKIAMVAPPTSKPATPAVEPAETAVKPQLEAPVLRPEPETPAVKPLPEAPAVKPAPLAATPVKPATRPAVKLATKPAPIAIARRNPVPAGVIETRLRRPFYDAERFGLVIPYEGRTPMYRWRKKTEGGVELELKGDVVSASHLQPEVRRHAALGTWKFDRRGQAGTLAVDVAFARPSELVIAADPERKQLLLIPQPRMHMERASESAAPQASLATVAMDRDGTNLYIPFNGNVPRYTIEQVNPSFAYINFERAALRDAGVQFFAPDYHPTVNYWMVSEPEGTTTVRLAVALARPGAAAVYQDPTQGRLVVVVGDSAPVVQATGPRTPRIPEPWPGAVNPADPAGEPVSMKEAS